LHYSSRRAENSLKIFAGMLAISRIQCNMDRKPKENIVMPPSILLSNGYVLFGQLDPPQKYRKGDFSGEIGIFEVFGKNSFNS